MKKFKELMEKAGDTAVFTFGRFNPPTTGHEKLIEAVAKQQAKNSGSKMYIYASKSNDPKKNPLPYAKKIAYMRKMFKKYAKNIVTSKSRTAIEVAVELHNKGHRAIVMVVGSDRVTEFDDLLNEYNGVEGKRHGYYGFDNIEVISAGERDPDAEGVEGMSASKMRAAAAEGDFKSFEMGLPTGFAQRKELYRDVRKGMGMREEREMGEMTDMESLRDLYLTGKIWNAGDIIEAKGVTGSIIRKGTNYVSFADDDGKVYKCWIHEIELKEAMGSMRPETGSKNIIISKLAIDMSQQGMPMPEVHKQMKLLRKKKLPELMKLAKELQMRLSKKEEVELDERNYAKEYANYQGTPEQIARRSSRNKARRVMGDKTKLGMDVGHKDNNPLNNDPANLRNEDPSKNRREPRLRGEAPLKGKVYKPGDKPPPGGWPKITFGTKRMPKKGKKEEVEIDELSVGKMVDYSVKSRKDALKHSRLFKGKRATAKDDEIVKKRMRGDKLAGKKLDKKYAQEETNLDEGWWNDLAAKIQQITHPKGYVKIIKKYADGMDNKDHREHPGKWAQEIAREYGNINGRQLVKYINTLVDTGELPKELKAEYEIQSFKSFVEILNKKADQGDYVDDFVDSDAPQFKGKSKKKRVAMAVAAYKSKKEDDNGS